MDELHWLSATDTAQLVRSGELRVREVASAVLAAVERVNPLINALTTVDEQAVLDRAAALDDELVATGPRGPLHGVPITIKELSPLLGARATGGGVPSRRGNRHDHDAVHVERLKAAGALVIGQSTAPPGGFYGGTDSPLFGPTRNPWDLDRSPGGSSGGAAAAVAAGIGALGDSSDGAGSSRIPAALCGVVGVKPTTGVVPGPVPWRDWCYHGPISRSVADAALMLDVAAGPSPGHPFSRPAPPSFRLGLATGPRPVVAGWSADLGLGVPVDPEVEAIARAAAERLTGAGVTVVDAAPRWNVDVSLAFWNALWVPGYGSYVELVDHPENRSVIGPQLRELVAIAERTTAVDVSRAWLARQAAWQTWLDFTSVHEVVLTPTVTAPAMPYDRFAPDLVAQGDLREQILGWLLTYPANLLNFPAVTVPAGRTRAGLPVGLQLSARHDDDLQLLRLARFLEVELDWQADRPPRSE